MRDVVDSYDLDKLSPAEKKLVPFLVILVKLSDQWKLEVELCNDSMKVNCLKVSLSNKSSERK